MRKRKWQRPKVLSPRATVLRDPNPRTLIQSLVQSVNLAEQPIEDPQFEKSLADQGYEFLLQHVCMNQRVHDQDLEASNH